MSARIIMHPCDMVRAYALRERIGGGVLLAHNWDASAVGLDGFDASARAVAAELLPGWRVVLVRAEPQA